MDSENEGYSAISSTHIRDAHKSIANVKTFRNTEI